MQISYLSDAASLAEAGRTQHPAYAGAKPFPHVVIDDFFDAHVLDAVVAEIDLVDDSASYASFAGTGTDHNKRAFMPSVVGPQTQRLYNHLNSKPVLDWLEQLTGIECLLPDPSCFGGGVHRITNGGFLEVHSDFNHLRRYDLERRVNLLLYLNKDWKDEYNGKLELWSRGALGREVAPIFNRCVVFSTTRESLHGHPAPLHAPPGVARKSIAIYYYTNTWRGKSEEPRTTRYYLSPHNPEGPRRRSLLRRVVSDLMPPIFPKAVRALLRKAKGETLKEL